MKAVFSQITDKGINEIYETYIDSSLTDFTDSHTMNMSSNGIEEA